MDLTTDKPSANPVMNGILPSPDHSTSPEMPNKKSSQPSKHHSSSHHQKHTSKHSAPPAEKLSPTSHVDALKKTSKDLQRSSFSLARYQVVLDEVKNCPCLI